jgi:hypothetical protein
MNQDAARNARKSLDELKRQLQNAQPVYVDSQGRLTTPEEEAARNQFSNNQPGLAQSGRVKVKPSRWF